MVPKRVDGHLGPRRRARGYRRGTAAGAARRACARHSGDWPSAGSARRWSARPASKLRAQVRRAVVRSSCSGGSTGGQLPPPLLLPLPPPPAARPRAAASSRGSPAAPGSCCASWRIASCCARLAARMASARSSASRRRAAHSAAVALCGCMLGRTSPAFSAPCSKRPPRARAAAGGPHGLTAGTAGRYDAKQRAPSH